MYGGNTPGTPKPPGEHPLRRRLISNGSNIIPLPSPNGSRSLTPTLAGSYSGLMIKIIINYSYIILR